MNRKQVLVRYGLAGFLLGCLFPLGAWTIESLIRGYSPSLTLLAQIHSANPLVYVIDCAPVVLCAFSLFGGFRQWSALSNRDAALAMEQHLREQMATNTQLMALAGGFSQDVSQMILQMVHDVELLNSTMTEIQTGDSAVSEAARTAEGLADETGAMAARTLEHVDKSRKNLSRLVTVVQDTVCQTRKVREDTLLLTDHMQLVRPELEAVSENSRHMSELITAISDISAQTRMLALNASIEASRSGEAGKGFGIIAREVEKLADEVRQSTTSAAALFTAMNQSVYNLSQTLEKVFIATARTADAMTLASDQLYGSSEALNNLGGELEGVSSHAADQQHQVQELLRAMGDIGKTVSYMNKLLECGYAGISHNHQTVLSLKARMTEYHQPQEHCDNCPGKQP